MQSHARFWSYLTVTNDMYETDQDLVLVRL